MCRLSRSLRSLLLIGRLRLSRVVAYYAALTRFPTRAIYRTAKCISLVTPLSSRVCGFTFCALATYISPCVLHFETLGLVYRTSCLGSVFSLSIVLVSGIIKTLYLIIVSRVY